MSRRILLLPALAVLLSAPLLEGWLLRERPTAPDTARGYTMEHSARGKHIFLSPGEYWYLRASIPLGLVLGVIAVKFMKSPK